jgi:hypothetical protein
MFVHVKLTPRRFRTEARFRGEDPWNGGAAAEFSIETYYYVPPHVREVSCPRRWANDPLYALRSELDGVERFLPDALSHLWTTGRVGAEALPRLLREMEPEIAETDYQPMLGAPTGQRMTAILGAVLLAAVGLFATWPHVRPGAGVAAVLATFCAFVVVGGLLGALFALPSYLGQRRRRRRQMGWALSRCGGDGCGGRSRNSTRAA